MASLGGQVVQHVTTGYLDIVLLAYGDIMHVHSPLRATLRARVRLSETIAFAPPLLLQLLPILPTVPLRPAHLCRPFSRCTSGGV